MQVNAADRADRRGYLPGIPTVIKPVSSGAADALAAAKFWAAALGSGVDENSPPIRPSPSQTALAVKTACPLRPGQRRR